MTETKRDTKWTPISQTGRSRPVSRARERPARSPTRSKHASPAPGEEELDEAQAYLQVRIVK